MVSNMCYCSAPRRGGFCRFHLSEKLVEHPHKVVVVGTSEDLRDKRSSLHQKLNSQLQTHEHKFRLSESILNPSCTNVRSAIVQYDVGLPVLQFAANEVPALWCGDVGGKGDNPRNSFYWDKINTFIRLSVNGLQEN